VSARARILALGLAGLAIASLLGLTGYLVSRETIALPATSLSAGEGLAPTSSAARTETAVRRVAPPPRAGATTAATTAEATEPTETADAEEPGEDDGGRGRGRGRGGDSRSESGSDSGSGSGDDSDGPGRGRGRGGSDD
jgi:hypothetical protein